MDLQAQIDSCSVCLQQLNLPTRLPCSHIFCFLCAKGAVLQTQKCPLCRQQVPSTFFNNPQLLETSANIDVTTFEGEYHWYYEGKNGWWLYDTQASLEIERQYQNKVKSCEILIAGFIYLIDFEKMVQYRKELPHKIRKIKRDQTEQRTKGIAGLRTNFSSISTTRTRNVIGQ